MPQAPSSEGSRPDPPAHLAEPDHPGHGRRDSVTSSGAAARSAAVFAVPYLVLALVWAFTNPPGASPDEPDHLVKALAAGRFDIGTEYDGPPEFEGPIGQRNASISRVVEIPAQLAPDGFRCTAFEPEQTADCIPEGHSPDRGTVERITPVGAYPVFGYVPMGIAARLAPDPGAAFLLARLVSVAMAAVFTFCAGWHVCRWLGRWAMVGLPLAITPVALFISATVSTSGLEITSAIAFASVVVVATRRPDSLSDAGTLALAAVAGSALVLSRQLGVVTLGVLALVALARGATPVLLDQLRRRRPAVIAAAAAVVLSVAALAAWELRFDHPDQTGSIISQDALGPFFNHGYHWVFSGVALFGWLDTPTPGLGFAMWAVVTSLVVGGAILVGSAADRRTLVVVLITTALVAYATYASVFYPVRAGIQGRHLLPLFAVVPMLAGVVLAERLAEIGAARRLFPIVGVTVGALQLLGLLANARRYAVGTNGAVLFFDDPRWTPRFGGYAWLPVAAVAAVAVAAVTTGWRHDPALPSPSPGARGAAHVER